ncbi:Meckel syndrome type 1 protein, putative [Trypanosoma equiperdum]|uniref:Meckel syndrome type 1 protein n=2 Tax=Trypanozoon TaxID=39700 RepID=Q57YX0_TRYB2|nr:hypothetical protein, conserved [Trypanosoma brucei brucei TREU927]AAX79662.1 hypothetical protein, conserved [Trypanosoma brucei]AAZ13108.1 hypothetical protein, conserved [Trypanosoma brucei brucei TREU927]SCU66145.1 Meckel syndrome type 1 protein, putative [Trypanosoma equiperdum]
MDFLQFCSSERYVSRVPVHNLSFRITLWRAPLVGERQLEQLCTLTVPWGGKVFSPAERLQKIRTGVAMTTPDSNASTREIHTVVPGRRETDGDAAAAADDVEKLREDIAKFSCTFFTRPPSEDYVSEAKENLLVDPPQAASPHVQIILREHQNQHQEGNRMYFMWASGEILGPSEGKFDDAQWKGQERVICTITAERNSLCFTAKPSLNKTHTLLVDSLYVYSFVITPLQACEPRPDEPTSTDFVEQIHEMVARIKDDLKSPHFDRRGILHQILLQQLHTAPSDELPPRLDSPSSPCFPQSAIRDSRVRYYLFGVVERCTCVAADTLYLHCQWQRGGDNEDEDDKRNLWNEGTLDGFTTQLSFASSMIMDQFIPVSMHTFNTPFDYHFDGWGPSPLRLLITAYDDEGLSVGGPQSPIGYAAVTVPHFLPGCHPLRAPLWRPRPTGREFVRSALMGGGPALVDVRDTAPRGGGGISVKCGLVSEPTGTVELRVTVFHQVGPL